MSWSCDGEKISNILGLPGVSVCHQHSKIMGQGINLRSARFFLSVTYTVKRLRIAMWGDEVSSQHDPMDFVQEQFALNSSSKAIERIEVPSLVAANDLVLMNFHLTITSLFS